MFPHVGMLGAREVNIGRIDFRKGPIPGTVVNTPIIGGQWIKPRPGSKYKIEVVMTSNAGDPKVPIEAKLKPYNA